MWPELRDEIELELAQLRRLLDVFSGIRGKTRTNSPDQVQIMALGGLLHSFYNGVENIFKRVTVHIDGVSPNGRYWHSHLLDNMARATPYRPLVITESTGEKLRDYMNFRHVFRHAYSFELMWSKMEKLVLELEPTLNLLESELEQFIQAIERRTWKF